MADSVILHGPAGSGKSRNAHIYCAALGMAATQDPWNPAQPIRKGVLHLTNCSLDDVERTELPGGVLVISVEEAKRRVEEML